MKTQNRRIIWLGCIVLSLYSKVESRLSAAEQPREANPETLRVRLGEVAEHVRSGNLDLRAAQFRIAEAEGRLVGAGRWQNPQVRTVFQADPDGMERGGEFGFNQAFPVTARLRLEKQVSRRLVAAARYEVADRERGLIAEAKILLVSVLALDAQRKLREQEYELATDLTDYATAAGNQGEGSLLEAGHARLEATKLELEIHHLTHQRVPLLANLRSLLGLSPEEPVEVAGDLELVAEPEQPMLDLTQRPDYRAALVLAESATVEADLERARRWQDVTLGVFAQDRREEDHPVGIEREQRIGVRLSVPLPLWNRNAGPIAEKTAKAARLEVSAEALANEIRNHVASAWATMRTLARHAREIEEELLPEAKRHAEQVLEAYENGLVPVSDVLRARRQRVSLEVTRLDALRDYYLARVDYETATGQFDEEGTQ